MSDAEAPRPRTRPVEHCGDAYGFLDQVRARPGMWVRGHSLREMETLLCGYGVALMIHGIDERFAFGPRGPFSVWLERQFGWSLALGCSDRDYLAKFAYAVGLVDEEGRLT